MQHNRYVYVPVLRGGLELFLFLHLYMVERRWVDKGWHNEVVWYYRGSHYRMQAIDNLCVEGRRWRVSDGQDCALDEIHLVRFLDGTFYLVAPVQHYSGPSVARALRQWAEKLCEEFCKVQVRCGRWFYRWVVATSLPGAGATRIRSWWEYHEKQNQERLYRRKRKLKGGGENTAVPH